MNDVSEQIKIIENLDKKIKIKETRVRGRNKTFIEGLDLYDEFKQIEDIKNFIKGIKNKYGCACAILEENTEKKIMFQGHHKENIKLYIRERYPKLKIE